MRILWAIFGTKMYIWYTALSAKINYLGFTMHRSKNVDTNYVKEGLDEKEPLENSRKVETGTL